MPDSTTTAKEWDEIRSAFATSIMINTSLSSLAQNLDGPDWPIKGKDETPATYIDYNHEEVIELLALKGQDASRLDQLVGILKDTLAFDAPFGEMVDQVAASAEKDNQFLKNLARLGVPEDLPIALVMMSQETREFCNLEQIKTIGEFAVSAQTMSQNVIVGGDFRELLNALAHLAEEGLRKFLPIRPGQKGVFLPEAILAAYRAQPERLQQALGARLGGASVSAASKANGLDESELVEGERALREQVAAVAAWFGSQLADMKRDLASGLSLDRLFVSLNNPTAEAVVRALLQPHLGGVSQRGPAQSVATREKKKGFFARLFGW